MTFKTIYHEYKNLVFNLALQYTQNIEDAEEISQDVFLKIYDKLDSFKQNSTFKTWIYRITINQSLDYIKAKKSQKRISFLNSYSLDSKDNSFVIKTKNHPGIILEQKEAIERIFDGINRLPENQKTVIILQRIEDKTPTEISEIMNISIKAVESLYQRAKKNLEQILSKNEGI